MMKKKDVRAIEMPRNSSRKLNIKSDWKVNSQNTGNIQVNAVKKNPIVRAMKEIVSLSNVGLRVFL